MTLLHFIFVEHLILAAVAALMFVVGLLLSWPVVRYQVRWAQRPALKLFRLVLRLIGSQPSLLRMSLVIWLFNSTAMFIYMSCGVLPILPKLVAVCTGFNVAVIFARTEAMEELNDAGRPGALQWIPGPLVTSVCGLVVLLVELPCFWYAIAMGISLGQVAIGEGGSWADAFELRGRAYGAVIVPLLLVSAVCESIAIRGAGGLRARLQQKGGRHEDEP
jgi:hypothetical protein